MPSRHSHSWVRFLWRCVLGKDTQRHFSRRPPKGNSFLEDGTGFGLWVLLHYPRSARTGPFQICIWSTCNGLGLVNFRRLCRSPPVVDADKVFSQFLWACYWAFGAVLGRHLLFPRIGAAESSERTTMFRRGNGLGLRC